MHPATLHGVFVIVNFVNGATVDFSVLLSTKNPYNKCCQMSVSLSEYTRVGVDCSRGRDEEREGRKGGGREKEEE